MTSRARLLDLYSKTAALRAAGLAREMRAAGADHDAARALEARLQRLMSDMAIPLGAITVSSLRNTGLMLAQFADEAARQRLRASNAADEVLKLQQQIATHEQRRKTSEDAAKAARLANAEEREKRVEAAHPATRRT
ncbi:hypothetical protein K7H22_03775 [Seohaeicola saemankumensis]|uniref:hypothetical protein n=1 Tax=Seohaeicola saemankumensis TaxID=481181 RepID=UPI001E3A06FD|nr:hypothetical protein [Seohaeicola saemankumensis]MCD1625112.1 hypothetical protein [Seohaeicola saemankumensis]